MKYITDIDNIQLNNTAVTLGKFDGNHIGHQFLFDTILNLKKGWNGKLSTVIFTFDINPAGVISNDEQFKIINTSKEKYIEGYKEGIDYVIIFPFNKETRNISPVDFIREILVKKLGVKYVVVGEDFCFGKDRAGNVELLKSEGEKNGFEVIALKKVMYKPKNYSEPQEVSSTLIKKEILEGNIDDVNIMLGQPFSMLGTIVHGKHLGNKLGFPTINFNVPSQKILPKNGVYATKTTIDGETYQSITNIGMRPTFDDGEKKTVETFIFDFSKEVYDKNAEIQFYKFIRPEKKFDSIEQLKETIKANEEEVRKLFESIGE